MKTKQAVVMFMVMSIILTANFLQAQAPGLLNYQGRLTQGGSPASGNFAMTFAIYTSATGGAKLWEEQWSVVPVTNGLFNVVLGNSTNAPNPIPSSVFAGSGERYLGIKIGSDPEMGPRFRLASVGYALRAARADTAQVALSGGNRNSLDAAGGDPKDAVFVDTAGRIGIGTKSPQYLLHLLAGNVRDGVIGDGAMYLESFPADDNKEAISSIGLINRGKGGTRYRWSLLTASIAGSGPAQPNAFEIWEYPRSLGNATPGTPPFGPRFKILPSVNETTFPSAVVINSIGNVGIGTTNPARVLDLSANPMELVMRNPAGTVDNRVWRHTVPAEGTFNIEAMNDALTGGTRAISILRNGNVGIGANTPDRKLHVVTNDGLGALFESKTNAGLITLKTSEGDPNVVEIINRPGGHLAFSTGRKDQVYITKEGNLGIGAGVIPNYILEVTATSGQVQDIVRLGHLGGVTNGFRISKDAQNRYSYLFDFGVAGLASGGVGIGKPNTDPLFALDVNGRVRGIGTFDQTSDFRYKKNITSISNAINKITRLRGVSFDWRQEEFTELNFSKGRNLGFIAQEIKEVLPEVVSQDSKGYYSVAYSNVVPVLVEAIKEQQQTIAQLQAQLQKNEAELAGFKEKMNRLEALLQRLEQLAARPEKSDNSF